MIDVGGSEDGHALPRDGEDRALIARMKQADRLGERKPIDAEREVAAADPAESLLLSELARGARRPTRRSR